MCLILFTSKCCGGRVGISYFTETDKVSDDEAISGINQEVAGAPIPRHSVSRIASKKTCINRPVHKVLFAKIINMITKSLR